MQLLQKNLSFKKLYIGNSREPSDFTKAMKEVQGILGVSTTNHLCERDARIITAKNTNPNNNEPIVSSEEYDAFVQPNQKKVEISLRQISTNKEIAQIELEKTNNNGLRYIRINSSLKSQYGSIKNMARSIIQLIDTTISKTFK